MLDDYLKELQKITLLEPDEERALWQAYKDNGDMMARSRLIEQYQPLVFKETMRWHIHRDILSDALQEGTLGLMEAVERYDYRRGVAFPLFAVHRIRGAILDYLRREGAVSAVSLDEPDERGVTLQDTLCDEGQDPAEATSRQLLLEKVGHVLKRLPEKEQAVVEGVYLNDVEQKHLAKSLNRARTIAGGHDGIDGLEQLDKVIAIDQSPIGRTPRSNPATYTGVFDMIRALFAGTPDAKAKGYSKGRFSFNVKGGRCEACGGDGILKIEMHFLPDVYVPCEVCHGKRYNRETLDVRYKGKNIYDVLDMTVEEAVTFFENVPSIRRKIQTLYDVGLGYVKLGQPSTELSGGEAQRIKLATELSRKSTGKTIYILDEPTTGLHFEDVSKLNVILRQLVEGGNTVVVIEHNLDVIKTADYIIDMGPEGGDGGGTVVARGTPEEVAKIHSSYTGYYIHKMLERDLARKNGKGD